jgi:hypothetical protein
MARTHGHGKLPKKQLKKTPEIFFDSENDFASIKIGKGIETKSYEKDGFIFSEDAKGKIIEIQILNLSLLSKSSKKSA